MKKQHECKFLEELLEETEDADLREQLRYSFKTEERLMDRVRIIADGHVFGVQVYDDEFSDDDSIQAYFVSFDIAHEFGVAQKGEEAELRKMVGWAAKGECGLEWISTVLKKRILAAQSEPVDRDF